MPHQTQINVKKRKERRQTPKQVESRKHMFKKRKLRRLEQFAEWPGRQGCHCELGTESRFAQIAQPFQFL